MNAPMRLAALLGLVLAVGCSNESQELGPDVGVVRAVHAIRDLGVLTMNLDSDPLGDFDYGEIRGINRPGDGNHEISFDVKLPGGVDPSRLETLNVATGVNRAQTLVLVGTADQPEVITWDQHARDWDDEAANSNNSIDVLEVSFGHAALSRGPLDIYMGPSPLDPATATPIASISYSDLSPTIEIDSDIVEIIVTPAGDPSTELYESDALALPTATSLLFVAFDGEKFDGDTPWLAMRSLGEAFSDELPNKDVPAHARVVHSARRIGSLEVTRQTDDRPLVSGLEFRDVSPYAYVPTGTTSFDFALTDDPDEVLVTAGLAARAGSDSTFLFAGELDGESAIAFADDNRRIATAAKFRVANGAQNFNTIDAYVLEPGTSVEDVGPTFGAITYPFSTGYVGFQQGNYDLVLTESGSKDPIVETTRIFLGDGGIYGVVATEGSGENRVEEIFIDDLAAQAP